MPVPCVGECRDSDGGRSGLGFGVFAGAVQSAKLYKMTESIEARHAVILTCAENVCRLFGDSDCIVRTHLFLNVAIYFCHKSITVFIGLLPVLR